MANGAFSGVIWGAVVAVAGAGGLSLAYPDFKPGAASEDVQEASAEEVAALDTTTDGAASETDDMAMAGTPVAEPTPEDTQTDMATDETPVTEPAPEVDPEETPDPEVVAAVEETDAEIAQDDDTTADAEVFDPEAGEPELASTEATDPDVTEPEVVETTETADTTETAETVAPEVSAPEPPQEPTQEESANADAAESITDEIIAALPKPEGTVGDLAPEVTTNRLPSLASEDAPSEDTASAVAPPPFERFASQTPIESDKPRMAIVLIDTGDTSLGVDALESFPYPLTFAVNASAPDAAERMQIYRDKGFEVLALVDLPRGATASDVEVAMSAYLSAVPEAVGILEGVETGVQTSREMADQLTQIILDSGHGMLLQKSGLNTARKLAEREGIPAATVFRDFDGNGQSASVMRRFLDQAAFRAGQEGGVVMMGRLQAETISALLIWGLADRASRVALVPVTAVIKQDAPDAG